MLRFASCRVVLYLRCTACLACHPVMLPPCAPSAAPPCRPGTSLTRDHTYITRGVAGTIGNRGGSIRWLLLEVMVLLAPTRRPCSACACFLAMFVLVATFSHLSAFKCSVHVLSAVSSTFSVGFWDGPAIHWAHPLCTLGLVLACWACLSFLCCRCCTLPGIRLLGW